MAGDKGKNAPAISGLIKWPALPTDAAETCALLRDVRTVGNWWTRFAASGAGVAMFASESEGDELTLATIANTKRVLRYIPKAARIFFIGVVKSLGNLSLEKQQACATDIAKLLHQLEARLRDSLEQSPVESVGTESHTRPPDDGWHFPPGEAAFCGVIFQITGKQRGVLKALADARGAARTWSELADKLSNPDLELKTITGYVSRTRTILRNAFSLDGIDDPIPNAEWGENKTAWKLDSELLRRAAQKQP